MKLKKKKKCMKKRHDTTRCKSFTLHFMKTTYTLINDNDYAFISRHETLTEARNAARAFNKL
jgi:hypothetical protein